MSEQHRKTYTGNEPTPPTGSNRLRQPSNATSRVLLLLELLEHILLYLSTTELMIAHNASPFFRRCILHSPRLLMRDLWLCPRKVPLTWYTWSSQNIDKYGLPVNPEEGEDNEEIKLIPRANTKTAEMRFTCQLAPAQPTTLCPLAQLWDLKRDRLPKGFTTDNSPMCAVGIIATPQDVDLYGDMIFTDPPVHEACAKLWYSHNRIQGCYFTGERTVKSDFPLTVRGFLDAAFRMRGETTIHDESLDDPVVGVVLHRTSFEEAISEWIRQLGGHFDLVFNRSPVCFKGVSVLRSDQWVDEEKKLAEQVREALA